MSSSPSNQVLRPPGPVEPAQEDLVVNDPESAHGHHDDGEYDGQAGLEENGDVAHHDDSLEEPEVLKALHTLKGQRELFRLGLGKRLAFAGWLDRGCD